MFDWSDTLKSPPSFDRADGPDDLHAVWLHSVPYCGRPTRVYALIGTPQTNGKVPAVVLVHGGGGTAYADWVRRWTGRGYAAIAIDTRGHRPGPDGKPVPHDHAGPNGFGGFGQIAGQARDQWMHHAVAAVIAAHSHLRTLPQVDVNSVGLIGVSWGGVNALLAAAVDGRFNAAAVVYSCGYLLENSVWLEQFAAMSPQQRDHWRDWWDPSTYLPHIACPVLFRNGTNDIAFPVDSWQKSYRQVPDHTISLSVRFPHTHPDAEASAEVAAFMDAKLRGGSLPRMSSGECDGRHLTAHVTAGGRAEIAFTRDGGRWLDCHWHVKPATLRDDMVEATAPADATRAFLSIVDAGGCCWSAEHVDFPQ